MKENIHILIVDDEIMVRESLGIWLKEEGYKVETIDNATDALERIRQKNCDLAIVDIKMPGMDGLEFLRESRKITTDIPILMITAHASIDTAVLSMKEGAYDYLVKPFNPEEVSQIITRAMKFKMLEMENHRLRHELEKKYGFDKIIGNSKEMQKVYELIHTVAESEAVVLIRGESGTGKELAARAVHENSRRRNGPLITLHCGSLSEDLIESELFGYVKGAFTGAHSEKKGRIEMAEGGTLFLDEIGDISYKTQVDLLRVIQERTFHRIGSNKLVNVDIRIISATNRNLEKAIEEGAFREDLYYRLNVVPINLPPLRDRKEDIPLLANHFLRKFIIANSKRIDGINSEAMNLLIRYTWPGNIRELENAIERAVVVSKTDEILPEDLPESIIKRFEIAEDIPDAIPRTISQLESRHIGIILNENSWNISKSADELGIDRATLYNKIKKYKIEKFNVASDN